MFKKLILTTILLAAAATAGIKLYAHCQIPCGIYDDPARFTLLFEHLTTVEKSMKEVARLSSEDEKDMNQIVRWVRNKEQHADEFTHIVTFYFMAQRIKPVAEDGGEAHARYLDQITRLHRMVFFAMKAKQSTNLDHVKVLRELVTAFKAEYEKK